MKLACLSPAFIQSLGRIGKQCGMAHAKALSVWLEMLMLALCGPVRLVVKRGHGDVVRTHLRSLVLVVDEGLGEGQEEIEWRRVKLAIDDPTLWDRVVEADCGEWAELRIEELGCAVDAPPAAWSEEAIRLGRLIAYGFNEIAIKASCGTGGSLDSLEYPLRAVGSAASKIVLIDAYAWKGVRGAGLGRSHRAEQSVEWIVSRLLEKNAGPVEVGLVTELPRDVGAGGAERIRDGFARLLARCARDLETVSSAWVHIHGGGRPLHERLHARFVYTNLGTWSVDPGLDQVIRPSGQQVLVSDRLLVRIARREDEELVTLAMSDRNGDRNLMCVLPSPVCENGSRIDDPSN